MSNSPIWQDQEDLTQPRGYFQIRKPIRAPAPSSPASELDIGTVLDPHNRVYLALSLLSLVALVAFFMPYFTVSTVVSGTPTFLNIPLAQSSPLPTAGSDAANGFPWLWLVLMVAVIDITVAAVLMLDSSGTLSGAVPPIVGPIVFLISGLAGFIVLLISLFAANSDISVVNQIRATAGYHVILGIGPGFWVSLLAMLCIAILGGVTLRHAW
ncbi:MAG: hypothetical protein ACLQUY_03615 [Ktedonobacterales bacterium]